MGSNGRIDERWYQVEARVGGEVLVTISVIGFRDANVDARRLRAQYPAAVVTVVRS